MVEWKMLFLKWFSDICIIIYFLMTDYEYSTLVTTIIYLTMIFLDALQDT